MAHHYPELDIQTHLLEAERPLQSDFSPLFCLTSDHLLIIPPPMEQFPFMKHRMLARCLNCAPSSNCP